MLLGNDMYIMWNIVQITDRETFTKNIVRSHLSYYKEYRDVAEVDLSFLLCSHVN